jgi:hypothetical protein
VDLVERRGIGVPKVGSLDRFAVDVLGAALATLAPSV